MELLFCEDFIIGFECFYVYYIYGIIFLDTTSVCCQAVRGLCFLTLGYVWLSHYCNELS